MTKSEQKVFDAIKAVNDRGHACSNPVSRTKGKPTGRYRSISMRSSSSYGEPNKHETAALERLLASGAVMALNPGTYLPDYVVEGHPVLVELAAAKDLMRLARQVEEKRVELEQAERRLSEAQAFVRRYGLGID